MTLLAALARDPQMITSLMNAAVAAWSAPPGGATQGPIRYCVRDLQGQPIAYRWYE